MLARRNDVVLLAVLAVLAAAVTWWAAGLGSRVGLRASDRGGTASSMVTSLARASVASQQYVAGGGQAALGRVADARLAFAAEMAKARAQVAGRPSAMRHLRDAQRAEAAWQASVRAAAAGGPGARGARDAATAGPAAVVDALGAYRTDLSALRRAELRAAAWEAAAAMAAALLLLGGVATSVLSRRSRRRRRHDQAELAYAAGQHRLAQAMAIVEDEAEAHGVLQRYLELSAPGHEITVFSRNNSDNRLEVVAATEADGPVARRAQDAAPRDCMAIRRAQVHQEGPDDADAELLRCGLCGGCPGASTCHPLVVGGRVIGSVLEASEEVLDAQGVRRLAGAVEVAAPTLAHVRTLAVAEARAATDPLTGLANRMRIGDDLKRMVAQASRSVAPLAVIAIDLDHFKQVNDRFGHDVGDDVLAAVGSSLRDAVRESDVVGRMGGEELVVLAPDTDAAGAVQLAEKLREAVAALTVTSYPEQVTASFGVAALPEHAGDAQGLLRRADRALYLAKRNGRDRVELAGEAAEPAVLPQR